MRLFRLLGCLAFYLKSGQCPWSPIQNSHSGRLASIFSFAGRWLSNKPDYPVQAESFELGSWRLGRLCILRVL
jgi:hypothetical protein